MSEQLYIAKIKKLEKPTFQKIRDIAYESISHLSEEERSKLYNQLKHGVKILETHEQLCQYLYSFGNRHEKSIHFVVDKLPTELFQNEYDIIDWGCGQGIATISFFDYLNENGIPINVDNIKLIEPGAKALERAKLHIAQYVDENKIQTINKFFDQVEVDEIKTNGKPVIHFFSNILDIKEIDLKDLAEKINNSLTNDNYIVAVGPTNATNKRIDWFYEQYFTNKKLLKDVEDRYFHNKWTLKAKVFKLEYNDEGNLIPIEYYPPVQFHSAYQLDNVNEFLKNSNKEIKEKYKKFTAFDTAAPFDIGASVYDDVHPVLAVLNNIITRGLPTKASPYIEDFFENNFHYSLKHIENGTILYKPSKQIDIEKYLDNNIELNTLTNREKLELELIFSPVLIARIQKTIIEAVLTGKLDIEKDKWKILVEENDVPGTALAIEDLKKLFNNLCELSKDYQHLKFPEIDLTIIGNKHFKKSVLHLNNNVNTEPNYNIKQAEYDLVLDVAVFEYSNIDKNTFSSYKALNQCYFNIRSSKAIHTKRKIYTTDRITYRNVVTQNAQGQIKELKKEKWLLTYFLRLLFRKNEFRDGQLQILNRALQNKAVIGLLPTGGGKSLTYQLAVLLQPGVTVIVDPLKSLMQDQYDGLLNYGIDNCDFINSSLTKKQKDKVQEDLEQSNLLFIFLSPERLAIYEFRERLKNMQQLNVYFSYGVIDEVHCVSEWGHDFRFTYLHLGRNLYNYVKPKNGDISLFGLTATASFDVLADVERELSGNGAFQLDSETIVRHENTNRLELQYKIEKVEVEFINEYEALERSNSATPAKLAKYDEFIKNNIPIPVKISDKWSVYNQKKEFLSDYLLQIPAYVRELQKDKNIETIKTEFINRINLQEEKEEKKIRETELKVEMPDDYYKPKNEYKQAGIVFCPHKNNSGISVNEIIKNLTPLISDIGKFYGGDDDDFMDELNAFRNNKKPLMVATKAFGMGIDKPNVRFTINMNYSGSLESFVQEAGRAGRDRKMALSVIFVSDYKLVRINPKAPYSGFPFTGRNSNRYLIKGKWFKPKDLRKIINHYKLKIKNKHVDYLTPEKDLVRIWCNEGTKKKYFDFSNCNDKSCPVFNNCILRELPSNAEGWHYEKDLIEILKENNLYIQKKYFEYQNPDYKTVMHFYNENFKGPLIEKSNMHELLDKMPIKAFYGNDREEKETFQMTGFLQELINANHSKEIVSFIKYISDDLIKDLNKAITEIEKKINGKNNRLPVKVEFYDKDIDIYNNSDLIKLLQYILNILNLDFKVTANNISKIVNTKLIKFTDKSIEKAIYRMTSIGLIQDFTRDYKNNRFRIVSVRHKEGEYYNKLEEFLKRYYSKKRAKEEVEIAKTWEINETDNELRNEIYRCLAYLTDFVYDKIATKRKRAIDDMRNFCVTGIDEDKTWIEKNEELKDYIYYYFNSKYAKPDYATIDNENFSLTVDTGGGKYEDAGKFSAPWILFKYLQIIDDEFLNKKSEPGSTAIDNVKHLQGAVKLIRRSLTDDNATISLLNAFTLMFLGTKNNENLEKELKESYIEGMISFCNEIKDIQTFFNEVFYPYNEKIKTYVSEKKLQEWNKYVYLYCHNKELDGLTKNYLS